VWNWLDNNDVLISTEKSYIYHKDDFVGLGGGQENTKADDLLEEFFKRLGWKWIQVITTPMPLQLHRLQLTVVRTRICSAHQSRKDFQRMKRTITIQESAFAASPRAWGDLPFCLQLPCLSCSFSRSMQAI